MAFLLPDGSITFDRADVINYDRI